MLLLFPREIWMLIVENSFQYRNIDIWGLLCPRTLKGNIGGHFVIGLSQKNCDISEVHFTILLSVELFLSKCKTENVHEKNFSLQNGFLNHIIGGWLVTPTYMSINIFLTYSNTNDIVINVFTTYLFFYYIV